MMAYRLTDAESFRYARQVPHWLDGDFGHGKFSFLVDTNLAVWHQSTSLDALLELWKHHVCLCNSNGRPDLNILIVNVVLELPRRNMAQRIHRNDLLDSRPLRKGANDFCWLGIREIRLVVQIEVLAGDCQSVIDGIGTSMCSNS
jgi:hypothetical protein